MTRVSREIAERLIAAAVSDHPEDMAGCYADHVVIEMPFTAGLYPSRLETTREELRQRFAASAAARRYERLADVRIHETEDPEVVIAEYSIHGHKLADGQPFVLTIAMVLTVRDGQIVHSRDYSDPVAGARVLGRLPELLASLAKVDQAAR
jgi:ketosteroid isomerase-like protein